MPLNDADAGRSRAVRSPARGIIRGAKGNQGPECDRKSRRRCQRRKADMRKVARRLFSFSQDGDLYRPLVLGAPSDSYSSMSHPGATGHPAREPVFPDVRKDDTVGTNAPVVSPQSYDEPIVTRKELWAYYCKCISSSRYPGSQFVTAVFQYITMETTWAHSPTYCWGDC
jgi:hypothetical protein